MERAVNDTTNVAFADDGAGENDSSQLQSASLKTFALFGEKTLLSALKKRFLSRASLCVVPLGKNISNGNKNETVYTKPDFAHTFLHTLVKGVWDGQEKEDLSSQGAWELLNKTSSWAPFTCGCVVMSKWDTTAETLNNIRDQLRLAAFLGLYAVIVPLPETAIEGDGDDCGAVFVKAVDLFVEYLRQTWATKIWVRCDASRREHRVMFSKFRSAILWGHSLPCLGEAVSCINPRATQRIAPYLFFSETVGKIPSEWLGEPVVGFETPSYKKIMRTLQLGDLNDSRFVIEMSGDVISLLDSYWASAHSPFVSMVTFMVELLRRRAMPVFCVDDFFEIRPFLGWLYEKSVVDSGRDAFINFEDVLQLPLQPLGSMLPSGTYEVFEQDTVKYDKYYEAMLNYFCEWSVHCKERSHGRMVGGCFGDEGCEAMFVSYVVLLGAGRGPLVGSCLAAASNAGVCVHIFAVEKNPEAMDVLRLRLSADEEWMYWIKNCGHTVETLFADGRAVTATNSSLLPKKWGLCDLVVSELLGSFGDNELSPECLDGFYKDILRYQASRGIAPNPHMVSIPQQYTAWIAPLHSGEMEEAIARQALSGLTAPPRGCHDRHAAIFHSMFVSNVCRGVALSSPQPCWTFRHFTAEGEEPKAREVVLDFFIKSGGRCSGFVGYFSAVLFAPTAATCAGDDATPTAAPPVTIISTVSQERTPNMFSWFPCVFALEPRDVMEVQTGDVLRLSLRRCVDSEKKERVWYSYDVTLLRPHKEGLLYVKAKTAVINEGGWAASILLSW